MLYLLVFAGAFGVPISSAALYFAACIYAGMTGEPAITAMIATAAIAAITGGSAAHALGHWAGQPALDRFGHRIGMTRNRVRIVRYLVHVHGRWLVFIARFTGWIRGATALTTGALGLSAWRYAAINIPASLIWAVSLGLTGHWLGDQGLTLPPLTKVILIGGAGLLAALVLMKAFSARKIIAQRAAEMFPDG